MTEIIMMIECIKRSKRREKKTPEKIEDIDSENTQKI
jgi:hypothetical protein